MSDVKAHTDCIYPEWWIYEGTKLIGKAFSAEKAAEFAAVPEIIAAAIDFLGEHPNTEALERSADALYAAIYKARGVEATT